MPSPPHTDARIGTLFGSFRIVRKLGEGGMGVVYEAQHQKIGRRVAVKLVHPKFANDEEYARRFLNEARAVNVIRHRGLVEIFDFGKLPDGTLYYVMELLEGSSLARRISDRRVPFKPDEVIDIAIQLARALAAAHRAGVVHRDLKPDNIMLEADAANPGQSIVKLLDFGIAKIHGPSVGATSTDLTGVRTQIGSVMGTQLYMPPEQHGRAEAVDGRADVFSLGVILFQLLTAELPFEISSLSLAHKSPATVHKLNPSVPLRLSALVGRMLAVRRDARPTMDMVVRNLAAMQLRAVISTRRFAVLAGLAGLLIGALLITLLNVQRMPAPAELRNRSHDVLATYLQDKDIKTRVGVVRAIGQSRDFDQRSLLEPLVSAKMNRNRDLVPLVDEAARALGQVGAADMTASLIELLSSTQPPNIQLAAAGALAQLQHPRGLEALRQLYSNGDELTKVQASLLLLEHRDFSGAPLLWASINRGRLSDERRVELLGRLARSDDTQARQRLAEELGRLRGGEVRVHAAYALAQLGEDSGWDALKQATSSTGAITEQLLALRLLAGLGDGEQRAKLGDLASDRKQPDSIREQAMAGLGDGAKQEDLGKLFGALTERGASARLRIAAAGGILKITAGEKARLGEQSLNYARAALGSDSAGMRELAVAMLADMESEKSIPSLGEALRDQERDIRRSAARALGKKNTRAALQALKPALGDLDPEVRNLATQSIGQVVKTLEKRGDRESVSIVIAELRRMTSEASELARVAASAVLLQLGEAQESERAALRAGLSSKDVQARRLAVELGNVERPLLVNALADPDSGVRLAAALQLAGRGIRDGVTILRAAVANGDSDGLQAYVALRKIGDSVLPPPALGSLLTSGDLPARLQILSVLPELPTEDAQRLVRIAMLDPAALVRRRAADGAADLYRRTHQVAFLRIVRSLRNDSDVIVRTQAATLADELERLAKEAAPANRIQPQPTQPKPAGSIPTTDKNAGGAAADVGTVIVEGDELVRFQVDKNLPQTITGQPLSLPIGKHRISFLGGGKEFQVLPGQVVRVRIPVTQAEQFLQDSKDALNRKNFSLAQDNLNRLRRLVQRGKADSSMQADLSYQQARLYEAGQQLDAALVEYNRVLNIPEAQRRSDLNAALKTTLTRISSKVGRIQVFTFTDGQCKMSREIWSPPGRQVIGVGNGQTRSTYVSLGGIAKVTTCP